MYHLCIKEKRIDFDERYFGKNSKLQQAILNKKSQKVLQLLRIGSDVNFRDKHKRTPLMAAAEKASPEMCRYLMDYGAEIEFQDEQGETAYLHACAFSKDVKVLEVFEKKGCNIYIRNKYNDTALFVAAEYNNTPEIIKHLLKKGFYPDNNDDIYGYTPLMCAARFTKSQRVLEMLLEVSVEYDLVDKDGCTALMHTAYHRDDNPQNFYTAYNFLKKLDPCRIKKRLFQKNNNGKMMLAIARAEGNTCVAKEIQKVMEKYKRLSRF